MHGHCHFRSTKNKDLTASSTGPRYQLLSGLSFSVTKPAHFAPVMAALHPSAGAVSPDHGRTFDVSSGYGSTDRGTPWSQGPSSQAHNPPEYGTVLRLDRRAESISLDHDFIQIGGTKPQLLQFSRSLTLAQGRILYEIWDSRIEQHVGYGVPSRVLSEVRSADRMDIDGEWKHAPPLRRRRLLNAKHMVVQLFPRMPWLGIVRVVERMVRLRVDVTRDSVEDAVVRYALHQWTNYFLRLESCGVAEDDGYVVISSADEHARAAVTERLKSVLLSWMHPMAEQDAVLGITERQSLVNEPRKEDQPVPTLRYYAGKETLANLKMAFL